MPRRELPQRFLRQFTGAIAGQFIDKYQWSRQKYRVDPAAQRLGERRGIEIRRDDKSGHTGDPGARGVRLVRKEEGPVDNPADGNQLMVQIGKGAALACNVDEV